MGKAFQEENKSVQLHPQHQGQQQQVPKTANTKQNYKHQKLSQKQLALGRRRHDKYGT
jgi:hypothetical protein